MYRYEVIDRAGKVLSGVMNASSEEDVRRNLSAKGYAIRLVIGPPAPAIPVPCAPRASAPMAKFPQSAASAPPAEIASFLRQAQSFLHSGVGLYDAMIRMRDQTRSPAMRRLLDAMGCRVQAGIPLSQAMGELPRAFPAHVAGVTAAGELGGFLPAVLGEIALDYEIEQKSSSRWVKWTRDLLWINCIGVLFLVPAMPNLPVIATEGFSGYLRAYVSDVMKYVVPPVVIGLVAWAALRSFLRRAESRPLADSAVLRVPWFGRASRDRSLANFTRMLWRLQAAGILPIQAWEAASKAANNTVIAANLSRRVAALRSGAKLSEAMSESGLFRDDDIRLLGAGEVSGHTTDILGRIAAHYGHAAMRSAGRVQGLGLHIAVLANILALMAIVLSNIQYVLNSISMVEREFEPMIWLFFPIK